jgi:hypothetical protein
MQDGSGVAMQACRSAGVSQCRLYVACCMLHALVSHPSYTPRPHTSHSYTPIHTYTLQYTRIPSNTLVYTSIHSYTRTIHPHSPLSTKTSKMRRDGASVSIDGASVSIDDEYREMKEKAMHVQVEYTLCSVHHALYTLCTHYAPYSLCACRYSTTLSIHYTLH